LTQMADTAEDIYPELVDATRNAIAQALPDRPVRVLDLCSGVGIVSARLLEAKVPIASLALADLSPVLLERASALLAKRFPVPAVHELTTTAIDVLAEDLPGRLGGPFDLVVTCNAFQHFPRQRQAELFRQIHTLLDSTGVFIFESHFKLLRPAWKRHIVDVFQARLRSHGAPAAFVDHAAVHINEYHHYVNLAEAYNWLEAAGFAFYDCVFRRDVIGIFAAVKQG